MFLAMSALDEAWPGEKWQALFTRYWPNYQRWYLSEGYLARPGYLSCVEALEAHMPELLPVYEELCTLAGGGDLAARFLSLYSPPPYLSGCSQMAWTRGRNALIRNYDYAPKLFDGIFLKTNWIRPVMAMSDCLWGALDGINADGLCLSLSFGGRKVYGKGFGIPLLLRYALETCANTAQAVDALRRIPVHMQYNVTVLDGEGHYATVYLAPDRPAEVAYLSFATNHQHRVEWDDYARLSRTLERAHYLEHCLWNPHESYYTMLDKFFRPPLFHTDYLRGFGTLYTTVYHPNEGKAEILWPHRRKVYGFDEFDEKAFIVNLSEGVRGKFSA